MAEAAHESLAERVCRTRDLALLLTEEGYREAARMTGDEMTAFRFRLKGVGLRPPDGWIGEVKKRAKLVRAVPERHPAEDPDSDWRSSYVLDLESGRPMNRPHNAALCLREHPAWRGAVAYDAFRQDVVLTRPGPWGRAEAPSEARPGPWREADSARVRAWLLREEGLDLSRADVDEALLIAAEANSVDPMRARLDGLVWDERKRLGRWLVDYMGAEDTPYVRFVGQAWYISLVARQYRPGCEVHHVLVWEGRQGDGKSAAAKIIGGRTDTDPLGWFSDTPIDLENKDRFEQIQGVAVYELAELEQYNRHEQGKLKSYATSPVDRFRRPYDRRTSTLLRRVAFLGTINAGTAGGRAEYLVDETGGRRWWPVPVGELADIDLAALARDVDQLYAEAVALFHQGAHWWPKTTEEVELCRVEQAARRPAHVWAAKFSRYLAGRRSAEPVADEELYELLRAEPDEWPRLEAGVGAAMRGLGWRRDPRQGPGLWVRAPDREAVRAEAAERRYQAAEREGIQGEPGRGNVEQHGSDGAGG